MAQMFRLKKNGESLEHYYINHIKSSRKKLTKDMADIMLMFEDFKEEFPWISVYGYGGQGGVGFHLHYEIHDYITQKNKIIVGGNPYNIPEEVMYTMLKLKGVNVGRYNLEEVWIEENE